MGVVLGLIKVVRRFRVGHVVAVLVRTKCLLLSIGRPSDEIVQTVPSDRGEVVVTVKSSRINRTKSVRPPCDRPVLSIATMTINVTPARVQPTTDLQCLINTIV